MIHDRNIKRNNRYEQLCRRRSRCAVKNAYRRRLIENTLLLMAAISPYCHCLPTRMRCGTKKRLVDPSKKTRDSLFSRKLSEQKTHAILQFRGCWWKRPRRLSHDYYPNSRVAWAKGFRDRGRDSGLRAKRTGGRAFRLPMVVSIVNLGKAQLRWRD